MRGLINWLLLIGVLMVVFVALGGLTSRTMIIVAIVAVVVGMIGAFLLSKR